MELAKLESGDEVDLKIHLGGVGMLQTEKIEANGFDIYLKVRKNPCMYEASGKIKLISDTQNFPSGFSKREFVVTTGEGKYPQDLKFEMVKDKCAILDNYKEGSEVKVSFDIRGNEYNGKYYVNLSCWKLEGGSGGGSQTDEYSQEPPASAQPSAEDLRKEDDFDDDQIPF